MRQNRERDLRMGEGNPADSLAAMLSSGAVYDERPINIAHLSDPHFTGTRYPSLVSRCCRGLGIYGHEPDTWDAVPAVKVNGVRPDLLIISGDLTAFGTPASLRHARERVVELARSWGVSNDRIFVVPGNHDRFLGYIGHAFRFMFEDFEDVFGEFYRPGIVEIDGKRVMVYPFDSTEEGFRLWPFFANTGRVRRRQFNTFNDRVSEMLKAGDVEVVVVILHHHPLPVPEVDLEGLTVMKNGGAFMAHMQKRAVDLVLHGHMHYSYACRINYSEDAPDTVIVAAGTACQGGKEKCSLSWIDLHPGRRAAIKVYSYSDTGFFLDSNRGRTFRLEL